MQNEIEDRFLYLLILTYMVKYILERRLINMKKITNDDIVSGDGTALVGLIVTGIPTDVSLTISID